MVQFNDIRWSLVRCLQERRRRSGPVPAVLLAGASCGAAMVLTLATAPATMGASNALTTAITPSGAIATRPASTAPLHDLQDGVLAQTGQVRSDRIVGQWRSSSGLELTLGYSGIPATFQVQVYRGHAPLNLYEATWTSNTSFTYQTNQGERIKGRLLTSDRIELTDETGRRWSWQRQ